MCESETNCESVQYESDLDKTILDPMIEIISETLCTAEVLKFDTFESDLENEIRDPMVEKIMNFAFVEREYLDTKFVLVSWDVGRRGLWYGNEKLAKEVNSIRWK
jgi:hypothetical protein